MVPYGVFSEECKIFPRPIILSDRKKQTMYITAS